VSKRYFDIYHALYRCASRGVQLHYVGGNHDFWVDNFFERDVGMKVHDEEILLEAQGRRVRCVHGDNFIPNDSVYRTIRSIIRNSAVVRATKVVFHPDLMDAIAARVSDRGKKRNQRSQVEMASQLAEIAHDEFFTKDNDCFIMGHVHYPLHHVKDGKEFMILGDWVSHFTYGKLRDGKLTLEPFKDQSQG
jgi:UDP-2,3-diacylglucosamine hydrolase